MSHTAKITSKGQVTLPVALRRALGLKPGDRVHFRRTAAGDFEMVAKTRSFADLHGLFASDGPPPDLDTIVADVAAARRARGDAFKAVIEDGDE